MKVHHTVLALALAAAPITASAQDTERVQKLFEAGQHQQVVEAAQADAAPQVLFTAGQSYQKLGDTDQAMTQYRRLAEMPDDTPWHWIGESAQQLLQGDNDAALDSARKAVERGGDVAEAQFQLGLVQARRQDWREAAEAFERVTEIDPGNAYAHYYGGLMQYRANRADRMAIHFEAFLKLAPQAPERPEVLQIMKTVRGR